ncbi:MAG: sensor histidine kinase, partial [Bacteroidota bacterium]
MIFVTSNLFDTIRQCFLNKTKGKQSDFLYFTIKKNFPKLFLFMLLLIFVLILVLIAADINNEYSDIIWAHSLLLIFSTSWIFLLNIKRKTLNRRSQWLFFVPAIILLVYISYLLGHYSYRAVFFSLYTTIIFVLSIIYTAKWQTTALLFLGSVVYLHFLTPYGKTGPSNYTFSNILIISIIVIIAWFFSRMVYRIYKNEYESQQQIMDITKTLENERESNNRLKEEVRNLKDDFNQRINERTIELNKEKLKAGESDSTKALFLANMSHELRTPLSGIIGTLEILSEQDITNEERKSLIRMALESSAELKRIIDELLEISRLRAGHFEISEIEFNPKRLFRQSIDLFQSSAKEKGLTFQADLENL